MIFRALYFWISNFLQVETPVGMIFENANISISK